MLVQNEWRHDTRVIREAEALARRGLEVHVICRSFGGSAEVESSNGVTYHPLPLRSEEGLRDGLAYCRLHLLVVLGSLRRRLSLGLTGAARLRLAAAAATAASAGLGPAMLPGLAVVATLAVWARSPLPGRARARRALDRLYLAGRPAIAPFRYLNEFARTCMPTVLSLRPHCVHAHDLVTLSAGVLAADRLGATVVYDAHELERHTNYHALGPGTKRWIARYEAMLAPLADGVVTVCDSIADWLRREYAIDRPTVVLNVPATSAGGEGAPNGDVRSTLGLPPETPLAIYVGSVTVDRGLDVCVRALTHAPELHLATVGPRYSETEREILDLAASLGVASRLHLVEAVAPHELIPFIRTADCSVMAIQNVCLSYYFCFPNKLLESVYAGLPVAVADLAELRRFVAENGVGVVMDERDPVSVARALRTLVADSDRYRPTPRQVDAIADRYGWPRQEEHLVALYDGLTHRSPTLGRARREDASCAAS